MPQRHTMRVLTVAVAASVALPLAAIAQPTASGDGAGRTCVDVKIGDEQFYSCLNDRLRRLSEHPAATAQPSVTALSPAPQVGTFNEAATSERLGSAFGHSVVPQRPPPPVFSSPLFNGR